eukprot:1393722-Amorphochlora_amoeboformis.AAC.1
MRASDIDQGTHIPNTTCHTWRNNTQHHVSHFGAVDHPDDSSLMVPGCRSTRQFSKMRLITRIQSISTI